MNATAEATRNAQVDDCIYTAVREFIAVIPELDSDTLDQINARTWAELQDRESRNKKFATLVKDPF